MMSTPYIVSIDDDAMFLSMLAMLEKHGIPYDEVDEGNVGKVHAQVYIDDKAWRFENK